MRTQKQSSVSDTSDMLGKSSNYFYIPVTISATGAPSIPSGEGTITVPSNKKLVWTSNQKFGVWFKDRLVPEVTSSKHKNGFKYAVEIDAAKMPFRDLPYEYVIETDGGRLDPKVIVSK